MNCNGYLELEFASYLVVNHGINVKQYLNPNDIPVSIAVNTDTLHASLTQETYIPTEPIAVPNPCYPDDPTRDLFVDSVELNVVKVLGEINYYVGADVLSTSDNVIIDPPAPIVLSYATTFGDINVPYLDILLVDDPLTPVPDLAVTVKYLEVTTAEVNDSGDHCYLITGIFRIDPINESGII